MQVRGLPSGMKLGFTLTYMNTHTHTLSLMQSIGRWCSSHLIGTARPSPSPPPTSTAQCSRPHRSADRLNALRLKSTPRSSLQPSDWPAVCLLMSRDRSMQTTSTAYGGWAISCYRKVWISKSCSGSRRAAWSLAFELPHHSKCCRRVCTSDGDVREEQCGA